MADIIDQKVSTQNRLARITSTLVIALGLGVLAPQDAAALPALASYAATYDISLVKATQLEGLRAASGKMNYALIDRCDGFTIETDVSIDLAFSNGLSNNVRKRYAGWEAKDGRRSTFRMQVTENGEPEDAYTGSVELGADGSGRAVYTGAETTAFDLPRGTILSSMQLRELIDAGRRAAPFVAQSVMDGAFEDGPYRTTGFIAPARTTAPVTEESPDNAAKLLDGPYWPVTLAYFPIGGQAEVPDYELNFQLLSNGVIRSMTQDYGAYVLLMRLASISPREGGCP